jgi:CDP-glycerol glycerophosphotransferase
MTTPPGPTLISVVMPVCGVEEYLPGCLDSVLGQPGPAIEVIAVDDASPDRCGEILDVRAGQDPRLRVIHLPASGGPGPARNRGLAEAAGEYVWFVDPDDLLAEGALAAVAAAAAAERPDLLLIGYVIRYPSGRSEPGPGAGLLRDAPPGLTLAGRPALIDRTMTCWSKVFRRAFLTGLRVPFAAGIHEDVAVSSAALLGARRISLLDRVCYEYRRRSESFLAVPSLANFAIFPAYDQVFAMLDAAGAGAARPAVTAEIRAAVFGRAMQHYTTILANGLVPGGARREFFGRMVRDYRRYRPPGYRPPPGLRGLKVRLVAVGNYPAYAVLARLNEARVRLRRTGKIAITGVRDTCRKSLPIMRGVHLDRVRER